MLSNNLFIGSVVDAIDLVASDVAVDPLNFRPEFTEYSTRRLRDGLEFGWREFSGTRNFAFDHIFGHGSSERMSECDRTNDGMRSVRSRKCIRFGGRWGILCFQTTCLDQV